MEKVSQSSSITLDKSLKQREGNFSVPIDGNKTNLLGEYRRFEDKILIPLELKEIVLEMLYNKMDPSYLDKGTRYTLIDSLYFDSRKLDFFQHHFGDLEKRYKMRTRRYGPNGVWTKNIHLLEVKRKKLGESKKTRFMISDEHLEIIKTGGVLLFSRELRDMNPTLKTKTILRRLKKVNDLITSYDLRPVMSVQYYRLAFEKDGFRVTLDHQLKSQEFQDNVDGKEIANITNMEFWPKAEELLTKYNAGNHFVMELKHQGVFPEWMSEFLQKENLEKTSFSKYCWFSARRIINSMSVLKKSQTDNRISEGSVEWTVN